MLDENIKINYKDFFISKETKIKYFVISVGNDVVVLSTIDEKHTFLVNKKNLIKKFEKLNDN
jgi:prefoldin subunit 5